MSSFEVSSDQNVKSQEINDNYKLRIFKDSLNTFAHILIGAVTAICIFFSFRNGIPLSTNSIHIILCVIGYQMLMAQAFLVLSPNNGWSANMRLSDKRLVHWVLQVLGSGLAIAGSLVLSLSKNVNFNTLHGKFALVAMVFTVACFFNGLASQYAPQLKFLPANLSKSTHVCFGIVAFVSASISLCYGFDKNSFKNWAADGLPATAMAFTALLTVLTILNPISTFIRKVSNLFR